MKSENFALTNKKVLGNLMSRILELPLDGTMQVEVKPITSKSARQRGLQHIWYGDVLKSGVGGEYESEKDLLDLASKYRWGLPILIRDDSHFAELYLAYSRKFKQDPERMMWFVKTHVHTESFSQSQMAEFLTCFRDHYAIDLGINLTDPEQKGWDNLLEYAA